MCGITLIIEHRVGHAPKERKRVGVVQDTLVFQQSLQLGDHQQKMCLDPGLEFLSTSRLSKLSATKMMSLLISWKKRIRTFLVVPSGTWRRIDGCGLLKTISSGVSSILEMKSPECLETERVSTRPARAQIFAE